MTMRDKGYSWAQVADEAALMKELGLSPELDCRTLLEFLELIEMTDFKFRYQKGDPSTCGIEARHIVLLRHIDKLKRSLPETWKLSYLEQEAEGPKLRAEIDRLKREQVELIEALRIANAKLELAGKLLELYSDGKEEG